ncbi:MAG: TRAP transporter substrate-binding protein DctP [Proteobacteria bacterium]|nr:TRAP transporter substrate-binding protein DctP [Pseudomonadota bacterium]
MIKNYLLAITGTFILALLGVIPAPTLSAGERPQKPEYHFKLATIAVEGTTHTDYGYKIKDYIEEKSGGRIRITWYMGAVMGDEPDELRKLRLGQVQGAAFTSVGMAMIASESQILNLPFFFRDYEELDYYLDKMLPHFRKIFADNGIVFSRWIDVGFNYWFTSKPPKSLDDLKSMRMWAWAGDRVANEVNQLAGFQNISIALTEVLTALQTGMLNAFYGPPYTITALQWYTQVKYLVEPPFSYTPATIVFNKKYFDTMPPDLQKIILDACDLYLPPLNLAIRKDNEKALNGLLSRGLKLYRLDENLLKSIQEKTRPVYQKFAGQLYPASVLEESLKILEVYRSGHARTPGDQKPANTSSCQSTLLFLSFSLFI